MTTEIFMASGDGVVHVTVAPGEYIIGRDSGLADIHIEDSSISASHAKLVVEKETVCIQDLDSENGTFVDGEPAIGLTNLYDGQTAVLGSVSLRVRQSVDPRLLGEGPRYVRGGMVAHGGMGAIHEARQSAMGRKVAMKVMLHSWSSRSVRRFLDEARITGMLEHPNIVPVHEMGVDEEDQFFYTMKFVKGATLAEILAAISVGNAESLQRFPLSALLTIFQKVCDAIAFAHSRGVWHRDLKPENIMIGDFGEVLVMDWGLAKESGFAAGDAFPDNGESVVQTDSDASASGPGGMRTLEGAVLGTPAYMSPEQARGETSDIDQRSDTYALGTILHEILYLQPAVRGKKRDEVLEKVAAGVRDAPEQKPLLHLPGHRVPASLEAVCRKAMSLEREKRYQQVTDLQADIAAYQSGFATSAESAGLGRQLLLLIKRNKGVAISTFAGLAALFVATAFFTFNLLQALDRAEDAKKGALASQQIAERKAKEAEDSLAREREMAQRENAANQDAAKARTGEQAAKAEAVVAKFEANLEKNATRETKKALAGQFSRMGRAAVAEGRPSDAAQLFSTAVDNAPDKADFLLQHGLALLALGDYDGAVVQLERAVRADPQTEAGEELAMAQRLQAARAAGEKPGPESMAELEKFLMSQGHASYVRLIDARSDGTAWGETNGDTAWLRGKKLVASRLGDLVKQRSWRDDRIADLGDGAFDLDLRGLELRQVPDLADTGVVSLNLEGTGVSDISELRGLSLRSLDLAGTRVSDLSPLANMPALSRLKCSKQVEDLSPLRGAPLEHLDIAGSRVKSLEPLREAKLQFLSLAGCEIADLQPLAGQPLRELNAEVSGACDFSPVKGMKTLVELRLPPGTGMPDLSGLSSLEEIFIPDLRAGAPMSGEEFRELDALRKQFWERYGKRLERLGLKNFGPERLLVRQRDSGFDLDLRGTGITDLGHLAKIPIHRLLVDTAAEPLDVDALGAHQTLRHLSLEGAWVPSIERLAANRQLASLVLSRDTVDTPLLARHPALQRLGYKLAADGVSPAGTVAEFFATRENGEEAAPGGKRPKYSFGFDAAADGTAGWRLTDTSGKPPALLWMADPRTEGGPGGGYITFYERKGNSAAAFFASSPAIPRNQRDLYGGLIEFRLRLGEEVKGQERATVVLVAGDRTLHHKSSVQPGVEWSTVGVPLTADVSWFVNGPTGPIATEADLREALARVREFRIQAEFSSEDRSERTDLDDVRIWDADTAEARRLQLEAAAQ